MLNKDYSDMLSAFNDADVEYLIVGAYALAAYGNPRSTGDIDIWVRPTVENAKRVWQALEKFGAPRKGLSIEDLTDTDTVFQIGVVPRRIDILTGITDVEFDEAWADKIRSKLGELNLHVLGREHLIRNKRATGRPKDLVDAEWLECQEG